jgi:predicted DNA-binding antitoxin AbrB/MazE fold protein
MAWTVVRGVYKRGVIEPLERAPHREGMEVLVLFPEQIKRTEPEGVWQRIKQGMAEEVPGLSRMTPEERGEEFDRLSTQVAERLPYRSLEEFERAMKGDEYGLVGH